MKNIIQKSKKNDKNGPDEKSLKFGFGSNMLIQNYSWKLSTAFRDDKNFDFKTLVYILFRIVSWYIAYLIKTFMKLVPESNLINEDFYCFFP